MPHNCHQALTTPILYNTGPAPPGRLRAPHKSPTPGIARDGRSRRMAQRSTHFLDVPLPSIGLRARTDPIRERYRPGPTQARAPPPATPPNPAGYARWPGGTGPGRGRGAGQHRAAGGTEAGHDPNLPDPPTGLPLESIDARKQRRPPRGQAPAILTRNGFLSRPCLCYFVSFLGSAGIRQCAGATKKDAPGTSTLDPHPLGLPGPGQASNCCSRRGFCGAPGGGKTINPGKRTWGPRPS